MAFVHFNNLESKSYTCAYCSNTVASSRGTYDNGATFLRIYECPHCGNPTYFGRSDSQIPDVSPGAHVEHVPENIANLFFEARSCVSVNAYTSSVLASRKLLMNIGVTQGAGEGLSFIAYVEYLSNHGFIPPNGRGWVDLIRTKGNEATHEISSMTCEDATQLITFVEMLLRFIYEFPAQIPTPESDA